MTTETGFCAIVGQQHPIALLRTLIAKDKLPHAMLFTGDEGVGKKTTARAFAMACNCHAVRKMIQKNALESEIDACGVCIPCKKIAGKLHPDILHISPLSSIIKIGQIRTLLQALTLKPNEANHRVVILSEAHTMNTQAANALLKILEEPPDRTLLVLTANHPSNLLPTIASRCRHLPFPPLDSVTIKQLLRPSGQLNSDTLDAAIGLSQGSLTRAQKYTDPRWLDRRNRIIRFLSDVLPHDDSTKIRKWLAFSETLSKKKDQVEESLEVVTMWLRDLLFINDTPERVINRDCLKTLGRITKTTRPVQVVKQMDAVENARSALQSNTNTRLTLDAMVLKMAEANNSLHTDV